MPAHAVRGLDWSAIACTPKGSRAKVSEHDMNVIDAQVVRWRACWAEHPKETSSLDCERCREDLGFLGPGF